MTDEQFLKATKLLDFESIDLVHKREHLIGFVTGSEKRLRILYEFVASLPLRYSRNDNLSASEVLKEGSGQCNTKVILLMALTRGAKIPCRLRVYKISREAQRGRVPEWLLFWAPKTTLFFWPEFKIAGDWQPLQKLVHTRDQHWDSCPFDGAKHQLAPLKPEWIVEDRGAWESPDAYFRKHKPTVHGWRSIGWHLLARPYLNACLKR
jgi:hypothetical protein